MMMIVLGLIGLTACSSDDDGGAQQPPAKTQYPLTIQVTENPYVTSGAEARIRDTRAAISTTASLTAFKMNYAYGSFCSDNDITVTANKGVWTADGTWPSGAIQNNSTVTWYAFTHENGSNNNIDFIPEGETEDGPYPYIDFTVDELSSKQKDLLVSTTSGTWNNTQGKIYFSLDHVCSALRFFVKKSTNMEAYTLNVSRVKLCNVKKKGAYHYNTSSWSSIQINAGFTLYSGDPITLGSTEFIPLDKSVEPYLFMIPQTLTAWDPATNPTSSTGTYFEIDCTIKQGNNDVYSGTAYIPFGDKFDLGYQHDVNLNIGKNSLYKIDGTNITKIIP